MTGIIERLQEFVQSFMVQDFRLLDIVEIIIIAVVIYHLILWVRRTQAWLVVRGIIIILVFVLIAYLLQFNAILWIFNRVINILAVALVVIFQPELRKALDSLGRRNIFSRILDFGANRDTSERFTNRTVNEIMRAVSTMAKAKTGALIVLEQETPLDEYERTGIRLDSVISSQLLVNVFEHNTPLHDGAVIMRNNRLIAATCYLPLSDNMQLSKALGTRHRAGLGMSEVTDALVVIVSEETGGISVAKAGELKTDITEAELRTYLEQSQGKTDEGKKIKLLKGKQKNEETAD
ncbi:MAG: diadenylate cyclase CdaA [Lachnospiraceae bacterium]|nr:diadenylate cyclase CdaA [Lachnospiraceae bacterium]